MDNISITDIDEKKKKKRNHKSLVEWRLAVDVVFPTPSVPLQYTPGTYRTGVDVRAQASDYACCDNGKLRSLVNHTADFYQSKVTR